MATKITKKENFLKLKSMVTDTDLIAFIDNEIALLDKKNKAKKGPSKTQKENDSLKATILNAMVPGTEYSVSSITSQAGLDLSNQKMSALLTQLVNDNEITRKVVARKAFFVKA